MREIHRVSFIPKMHMMSTSMIIKFQPT